MDYNNNYGYGFPEGNPYPPKKNLITKMKEYFLEDRYIVLSAVATVIGLCIVVYQFLGMLYAFIIRAVPGLMDNYLNNYMLSTVIEMFYTVLCVGGPFFISYIFMRKIKLLDEPLSFGKPYSFSEAILLVVAGLGLCFIGNIVTGYFASMMSSFGIEFYSYNAALSVSQELPKNAFEFCCMVMHTAVMPAIFEEFAFRGVIMQPLRKYGDFFAIFVSAVLFGLVHGNMTQMPFAIIAGFALGYSSIVTGSLWTGVVIHFLNNFISLMNAFAKVYLPESRFMIFSLITVYGLIAVGVVAGAMYVYHKPEFLHLRLGKYGRHKKSRLAGIMVFIPSMAIALVWMLVNIAGDMYI